MELDPILTANLLPYIGLAGGPQIQQLVQYLKNEWKLPTYLTPLAAILIGVVINVGLSPFLGTSWQTSIIVGVLAGFVANGWHEIAKK